MKGYVKGKIIVWN